MRWLLRFLAWTTVLALPFWLLGDLYNRALVVSAMGILGLPVAPLALQPPDIPPSHVLGVFAALCLASTRAPVAKRVSALVIGLAGMMTIDLLTGVLAIHWALDAAAGRAVPVPAQRLENYLTSLPAWIGAPVLWLVLLGRWELPRAGQLRGMTSKPAAGG